MMTIERTAIGWRFWVRWMLLTVVGYSVGFFLGLILADILFGGNVMMGVGIGAGVGFMQWLALRRIVQRSGWWAPANIAGLTVCLSLYAVVHTVSGYPFNLDGPPGILGWVLAFVVGGTMTGVLQQRILRRHVGRSAWWVLASALGWGLSVIGLTTHFLIRNPIVVQAVAGVILGTVTGGALIWLLRQPTPGDVSRSATFEDPARSSATDL